MNVYEDRIKSKGYIIVPKDNDVAIDLVGVVVVIHLHYVDTLFDYYKYIDVIPKEITVVITTSVPEVYELLG